MDKRQVVIDSGTEIVKFPKDGYLVSADLREEPLSQKIRAAKLQHLNENKNQTFKEIGFNFEEKKQQSNISKLITMIKELTQSSPQALNIEDLLDQNLVPTIGIVDKISNSSGKIIVMADSDCVDTSSVNYRPLYDYEENVPKTSQRDYQYKKCFWLMEKFADIATGKIEQDAVLMSEEYRLPSDF